MSCLVPLNSISSFSNKFNSFSLLQIQKFDIVEYWIKSFVLPGIQLDNTIKIDHYTNPVFFPSNIITHNEFNCSIFVDENLVSYRTLLEWFDKYIPETFDEDYTSIAALLLFDNNRKNIIAKFTFENLFITSISDFEFKNVSSDDLIITAHFAFDKLIPEFPE